MVHVIVKLPVEVIVVISASANVVEDAAVALVVCAMIIFVFVEKTAAAEVACASRS